MQSDDKRYLRQMLSTLNSYRTSTDAPACANPIDDEVFNLLDDIEGKLTEDAFDIFRFKKPLLQLWKKLIEKSIVCLRYFDTREPFGKPDVKKLLMHMAFRIFMSILKNITSLRICYTVEVNIIETT